MLEKVLILGRPNVGKSTLFNRLLGTRKALVHHKPGTTRDTNESTVSWKDKEFALVDTAGWIEDENIFSKALQKQLEAALAKADVVVFLVDGKEGYNPHDAELAKILRKMSKQVILAVNKIDRQEDEDKIGEFYKLGIKDIVHVGAANGRNIPELLETILARVSPEVKETPADSLIKIILVGKPNVGKSSLVNKLAKQERSVVFNEPGTTREAIDVKTNIEGQELLIIDTPGLHKAHKFTSDLEYLSSLSAQTAMAQAEVAVLVVDAMEPIGETESKIAELIQANKLACLIAINKWDLKEDREYAVKTIRRQLERKLHFISWAKVTYVSAKTGLHLDRIAKEIQTIYKEYSKIVPQEDLNEALREAVSKRPISRHGSPLRIKSLEQVSAKPPKFLFMINDIEVLHFSNKRYFENVLREKFGFDGTPILLSFKQMAAKEQ
jgi:GTPase